MIFTCLIPDLKYCVAWLAKLVISQYIQLGYHYVDAVTVTLCALCPDSRLVTLCVVPRSPLLHLPLQGTC